MTKQPKPIRYVIQPGDTTGKIAKRFKTEVTKLVADNKATIRDPNKIFPGKVIWIYGKGPSATARATGGDARTKPATAQKKPAATSAGKKSTPQRSGQPPVPAKDDGGGLPDWMTGATTGIPSLWPFSSPGAATPRPVRSKENRGHPLGKV